MLSFPYQVVLQVHNDIHLYIDGALHTPMVQVPVSTGAHTEPALSRVWFGNPLCELIQNLLEVIKWEILSTSTIIYYHNAI